MADQHRHLDRPRLGAIAAIAAATALFAVMLTTSPALAFFCDTTTSDVVVRLDDSDIGTPTTLAVRNNVLYVNDVACTAATTITTVTVVELPTVEQADDIIIDLTEPMRIDGQPVIVNLVLDPDQETSAPDRVQIIGSSVIDRVRLFPEIVVVTATNSFPGSPDDDVRLSLGFHDSAVDLEFQLGGDNDTFEMVSEGGETFANALTVRGGAGNDTIHGGPGNDTLSGGEGSDTIVGGSGDDILSGDEGSDTIRGGGGNDTIRGGADDDTLQGGKGADNLRGQLGDDRLLGQSGKDTLHGGSGDDEVRGGTGADTIKGGSGADGLYGNSAGDTIRGGKGRDFLNGGKGRDTLFGNSGPDTFETDDGVVDAVNGGSGTKDTCNECDDDDVVRGVENL